MTMRQYLGALLLSGLMIACPPASLAMPEPDGGMVVPTELQTKIRQLLEISGAESISRQASASMIQQMMRTVRTVSPEIPERDLAIVADVVQQILDDHADQLFEQVIPLYAEYFTEADIDSLIAFYQTPIGQKVLRVTPELTQATLQLSGSWVQRLLPQVQSEIQRRLQAEGTTF